MKSTLLAALMLFTPLTLACQVPDFSGSFSMTGEDGAQIVVTLRSAGGTDYAGTMSNAGLTWQLQGDIYEDALTGTVNTGQGMLAFEAYVYDDELELILVEMGADGMPDVNNGQEFIFTRTGSAPRTGDNIVEQRTPDPGLPPSGQMPASSSDPYVGTFSNGQMTLMLQGGNGSYQGQVAMGNEAYPVAVQRNGDRLEGVMNATNGQYSFYLMATQDGVSLDSAGEIIPLARTQDMLGSAAAYPTQPNPQTAMPGGQQGSAAQQGAGAVDNSPLARQWHQSLAGKKVTYISSYNSGGLDGGGMSTKNVYHICSDGRFAFSDNSSVTLNFPQSPDLGTPGTADGGQGTWRIITEGQVAGIELRFNTGEVVTSRLDMQNGQTFANGDRVYVTPGELCR